MARKKTDYTEEFRREAVNRAEKKNTTASVAQDLGVSEQSITSDVSLPASLKNNSIPLLV